MSKPLWIFTAMLILSVSASCSSPTAPEDTARTYYVSSADGSDAADGLSAEQAWKTIARLEKANFEPGDRILLKAGERFGGGLSLDVRGSAEAPIVIASYGEGPRPVLDGGEAEAALHLTNPAYLRVEGLAVTNPSGYYGVRIVGRNGGELNSVVLQDLDVYDVFRASRSNEVAGRAEFKNHGGISIWIFEAEKPTWFDGLTIRRNNVHDLGTCGICMRSEYPLHAKRREGRPAYPSLNVVLEDNRIHNINRDGVIIRQVRGAVMQYNEVARTGLVSVSNGMWYWDAESSVIQYNEGFDCRAPEFNDGGPFSIDYYGTDNVIQYNYSHDNEGPGMMAFGRRETGQGTIIRRNVSYNDNTLEQKTGFAAVSMISKISEAVVEENTVIAGPDTHVLIGHRNWDGLPEDVVYRNNCFVGNGNAYIEGAALADGAFQNNRFLDVPNLPPHFEAEDTTAVAPCTLTEALQQIGHVGPRD